MPAVLPHALQGLMSRTFLATFRVSPRPMSLSESLQFYSDVQQTVSPLGQIVHYKQQVCPVTKERLERLNVLVEDFGALPDRVDIVHNAEPLGPPMTPLETAFAAKFKTGRLQLQSLTRDFKQFEFDKEPPT